MQPDYNVAMSTLEEIKVAIEGLTPAQRAELEEFLQRTDDAWDRQMAADAQAGKFDRLIAQVDANIDSGNLREFPWSTRRPRPFGTPSADCQVMCMMLPARNIASGWKARFVPPCVSRDLRRAFGPLAFTSGYFSISTTLICERRIALAIFVRSAVPRLSLPTSFRRTSS